MNKCVPEKSFQIVGKLRTPSVARIHCSENGTCSIQRNVAAIKCQVGSVARQGLLDGENLLGNHTEDLQFQAVELIQAAPGATGSQPLEHSPHDLVIQALRTVKDTALLGDVLSQILDCFCLSGSCRAFWCPTKVQVER